MELISRQQSPRVCIGDLFSFSLFLSFFSLFLSFLLFLFFSFFSFFLLIFFLLFFFFSYFLEGARKTQKSGGTITVGIMQRGKKKHVTVITGMGQFSEVKLKEASKFLANRHSCGATVSKEAEDVIEVQGDILKTVVADIQAKYPSIPKESIQITGKAGSKKGRKKVPGAAGRGGAGGFSKRSGIRID